MKKYLLAVVTHPAGQAATSLLGILIMIGTLHNHAHYEMSNDPDAYVYRWCKKNPERCKYTPK